MMYRILRSRAWVAKCLLLLAVIVMVNIFMNIVVGRNNDAPGAGGRLSLKSRVPSGHEMERHLLAYVPENVSSDSFFFLNETKMVRQAKVQQRIEDTCGERKPFSSLTRWQQQWVLKHMVVDDKYNLLYCFVPKVGCANWKRVFSTLYGDVQNPEDVHKVDHTSMHLLSSYSKSEVEYRLLNYFKFMFVRHPMDRLISAYRNKFGEHFPDFERRYGTYIVKNFRPNPPLGPKGDDVTFPEFLAYVAGTDNTKLNEHWSPFVDLCQPCHVGYDYIGYFEQFDEDINFLLDTLKLDSIVHYPKKQAYYKAVSDEEKNKVVELVPMETLRKLREKLSLDYELFGYPMDSLGEAQL